MKKIFLFISIFMLTINFAQAEQWIYLRTSPNSSLGVMFDLDSIKFDENDNSITFNILKDDETLVFIHKMKYLYDNKQFAVLESTKYNSWVAPENKVLTQTFDNPKFQPSEAGTNSERLEMLITDKNMFEYFKNYANNNRQMLVKELEEQLVGIDDAKILFWIDGQGNIKSYQYLFGNQNDTKSVKLINKGNDRYNYSIDIECFPNTERGKMPSIHIHKKQLNSITKNSLYSYSSSTISSMFISRSMLPSNMPSMARTVYQSQRPMNPDSAYGVLPNKEFYNKFMSTMTDPSIADQQKKMAMQLFAIQSLNYNEQLNLKLKEISQLNKFSDNYTNGLIGIVINLK